VSGPGAPPLAALRRPCSIRVWPERPAPGELVRLPLPCPAQLVELSHYRGDRRWIALWSSPAGDELIVCDGAFTITAPSHAWTCFCAHPLVGVFLEPYRLGQTNDQGEHRLVVDRYLGSLHVGLAEDVEQLLATQPSDLIARTDELSPGEMRLLRQRALALKAERERADSLAQLHAATRSSRQREQQLLGELIALLDDAQRAVCEAFPAPPMTDPSPV
jgi:hypothetical protein